MKNKFTLIELLVVISIIGILTSMLLPSLRNARDSSRNTLCLNNLKQMYISFQVYADDNNGFLLQHTPVEWEDPSLHAWKTSQAKHLKDEYMGFSFNSFYCPMDNLTEDQRQDKWNWGGGRGDNNSVVGYSKWSNNNITNPDHFQQTVFSVNNDSPLLGDLYRNLSGNEQYMHTFSSGKIRLNFCSGSGGAKTYSKSSFTHTYGLGFNQYLWPDMK